MTEHVSSPVTYYIVFAALLVLTVVTAAVAYVPLGPFSDPVALLIAGTKATLVILFFMHALHSEKLVIATIGAACLFLTILIGLTMTDFLSRGWVR